MPADLALVASTGTTVLLLVLLLIALGVAMVAVAVWLVRSTRTDVPALAPLEVMGDRGFRRADPEQRAGRLTASRPEGAPPPAPIVPIDDLEPEPDVADEVEPSVDDETAPESAAPEDGDRTDGDPTPPGHTSEVADESV